MSLSVRVTILCFIGGALVACTDDGVDPHGHADVADVNALLDRPAEDATSMDVPATDEAPTDDVPGDARGDLGPTCSPSCGVGQVCCTDQHGHFPACQAGSTCADAGGS